MSVATAEETFGDRLRRLRERAGLSQQELADRAALTPHAVSALERGTRTRPYPHTVRSLADALGLSDAERTALIASVRPRRRPPNDGAAPWSEPSDERARPLGLVVPPTPLFGREQDVAAVTRLTEAGRLVTLVGPGGVGKTRLAAAASAALATQYPDGVVQVSLAPLVSATEVVPTIARAVGLGGGTGLDDLVAHLEPLRLLLVLDNFEHLLSAAPEVGRLAALCPRLTVLVSSRSPLRVRAEQEYLVQPLELPSRTAETAEQLAEAPAGALLLDRGRAVAPQVGSDPDDVRALAELCHRLAGLPLAIELTSARLRLMPPQLLLERLEEATAASGARDLPERQRTMRATLDWSYGLLSGEQQRLFTLLAAFHGGATVEAVESVAVDADGFAPGEVLARLEELVEQSLVVVRPGPDRQPRFDLLDPVGQYARSLLVGERAARIERAHARFFLSFAERAAVGYERADQVGWLVSTETDEANLLVAVERALDLGEAESAGLITWSLWLYWWLRGRFPVGRRLADQCLSRPLSPAVAARTHLTAATMAYAAGDHASAAAHWAESDRIGAELDDPEVRAKARAGTGLAALSDGDLPRAADRFRSALAMSARAGEAGGWIRSLAHVWLGTTLLVQGDPTAATTEIERGLALARGRGDRLSTYVALYNLSQAALALGDDASARRHVDEGIILSEQTRDLANLAYFLETLAVIEARSDNLRRAAVLLGAANGLRETVGSDVYAYYLPDDALRVSTERAARDALGNEEYDDAVDAGRGLELPEVIQFVLGDASL